MKKYFWYKLTFSANWFLIFVRNVPTQKYKWICSFYKGLRRYKVSTSNEPFHPWTCRLHQSLDHCKIYYIHSYFAVVYRIHYYPKCSWILLHRVRLVFCIKTWTGLLLSINTVFSCPKYSISTVQNTVFHCVPVSNVNICSLL